MTTPRLRVAHVGTGLTGREALGAIVTDPALDLVALLVSTPDKVGTDAGELCGATGGEPTGVLATADRDAVIALRPDCVCYCATAVRREDDAVADIAAFLRAGIDVVTISVIPLIYPPAAPARWRDELAAAAEAGGATFYATGSEPGVASLTLPPALLAGAGRVDSYRIDEYAPNLDRAYPIWDVLHASMGFGQPAGHVPARIAAGKVEQDWATVVRHLADVLGITLDAVELDWETLVAEHDLPTELETIKAGTICGHRWQLSGTVAGEPVVGIQYFATVTSTPWPDHWPAPSTPVQGGIVHRVTGDPNLRLELYFDPQPVPGVSPGVRMTAVAVVNAIPAVVAAAPGLLPAPLTGPQVASRQATARR